MDKMIELQDVSYSYPNAETKSLTQINLVVERGKLIVVMGPAGSGKTTLSLCLNGLIPQLLGGDLTGNLTVAGRDLRQYRVQTLARHIGLVLQDPETQIFGITVAEDTAFGPRNFLVPAAEIEDRVKESLQCVRLQGYQNRNTAELSGGEKQRLAIAGVLALQPEVLVLDEPASELDPAGRMEIYQTITDLRRDNNLTILMVEPSGEAIIDKADAVIVLNQGQIVWQETPERLFRNIPRLSQFGIQPLPVSKVGWTFFQKGWITETEIPLDVPAAESMIRNLLAKHGTGRFINLPKQPVTTVKTVENAPVILQAAKLSFQYPNSDGIGLRDINLTVRRGEFVALIGPNGAGKTTLAKHFNGLLKPTGGDVIVDGMNTRDYNTARLAQMAGYVFQNPDHQIFAVSVEKELEYGLKNAGLREAEIQARIDKALQWVRLEPYRKVHPFTLGKGQRQLVALASILALEPKILVIDEPTTGLDWTGVRNIMGLIKDLNQNGTTIIMITHDMDLAAQYAQRILVMKDGGILRDGKPEEVLADLVALRQACIVPPQIVRLSQRLRDIGLMETLLNEQELITAILNATEGLPCQ
jgi:energy-coupling factor transport system ATP-binding protein